MKPLASIGLLCILLASTAPAAVAADSSKGDIELTPFFGYGTSDTSFATGLVCIPGPCPSTAETDDGTSFGLAFDYAISDDWWFEVLLARTDMELGAIDTLCPDCGTIALDLDDLEITTLHLGLQHRWSKGGVAPFVAFGAGLTQLSSRLIGDPLFDIDEDRLSASLAAGLLAPINDRLGFRLEARGYWVDLPDGDFVLDGELTRAELSGGLAIHW